MKEVKLNVPLEFDGPVRRLASHHHKFEMSSFEADVIEAVTELSRSLSGLVAALTAISRGGGFQGWTPKEPPNEPD